MGSFCECGLGRGGVGFLATLFGVLLSSLVENPPNKTSSRSGSPLSAVMVILALLCVSGDHTFAVCACSDENRTDCSRKDGTVSQRGL